MIRVVIDIVHPVAKFGPLGIRKQMDVHGVRVGVIYFCWHSVVKSTPRNLQLLQLLVGFRRPMIMIMIMMLLLLQHHHHHLYFLDPSYLVAAAVAAVQEAMLLIPKFQIITILPISLLAQLRLFSDFVFTPEHRLGVH